MRERRHFGVMLSSTFWDLEEKRKEVVDLMRRHDLYDIAMENDAALATMDKIDSSLAKVQRAKAYICIIGYRYGTREVCERRNPDKLSLTELEFHCAQERNIPRCTLIMSGQYKGIALSDYEAVSAEDRTSLASFRKLAEADRVYAPFGNDAEFTVKVMQSLEQLRSDLDAREQAETAAVTQQPPSPDDNLPTAPPAFHYVRKPYVEKQGFAGRTEELALIDRWAIGPDAMLLFQAIGGMGKSMLTWHWLKKRAAYLRSDWAGQLWYSFYEQGADLNDFCVHVLAYIRHQPPRSFRGRRTIDLGDELRRELDARPWLLILDGLERVLVAYNRAGKEHMTDEDAVVAQDGMGLDREPRDCFRPEDDDVLAIFAQVNHGKMLVSSRLTPAALMNAARQPIPGVTRVGLEGLAKEDAEAVLRKAGIRGDSWRIQHFLAEKFDGHPLSIGVVAGQVMTLLEARGDFDRWVDHPRGGGDPALITKDLRGRQNHILSRAFADLDDDAKALLGSIAMVDLELTLDILRILNPKRPIEPRVGPLSTYEERDRHVVAHSAWQREADDADAWLERILPALEARGLLQYEPETGSLDMHPAIRHTALEGLSAEARGITGIHVSDALSSRPFMPCEKAITLGDLALVISRVKALSAAGKLSQAFRVLFDTELARALLRLEYHHEQLELLQPGFPGGWKRGPVAPDEFSRDSLMMFALLALRSSGQQHAALKLQESFIAEASNAGAITFTLGTFALDLLTENMGARATRLMSLTERVAQAEGGEQGIAWVNANQARMMLTFGRLDDANEHLARARRFLTDSDVLPIVLAPIIASELEFLFRTGSLTDDVANELLPRVRSLGERSHERICLLIIAMWHQNRGNDLRALDALSDLIALANEVGSHDLPEYEGRRGLSLAKLGHMDEARRIAERIDGGNNRPHTVLAKLFWELGDKTSARKHALEGYKAAWGEGKPHCNSWDLDECRRILAAVKEPEPELPSLDLFNIQPFTFEPDIERLIKKTVAENAERAAGRTIEADQRLNPPKQS